MNQNDKSTTSDVFDDVVLAPLSRDTFFNEHWERGAVHIERAKPTHFQFLVTTSSIKTLLSNGQIDYPDITLANTGSTLSTEDYLNKQGRVDVQSACKLHEAGATLVISQAHKHIPELTELVDKLTKETQHRWQANAYLTPAGNQGFAPHYDTHDVFILQVEGKKTFRFFTSDLKLPFTEDTYDASLNEHAELCDEVTLHAGDTLYIPRGNVHDAVSASVDSSLHITLGCYALNQRDLLQCFMQVAAEQLDGLRHSIPNGIWLEPENNKALLKLLLDSLREISDHPESAFWMEEAVDRLKDEFALSLSIPEQDDSAEKILIESQALNARLDMESCIRIIDSKVLSVQFDANYCRLRCPGRLLEFDTPLSGAVEQLLNGGSVKLKELESLSEPQALALARQLISESLVELAN